MNATEFVKLSTSVCTDLRSWVEEARRRALLSEGQLLTLSDAADVIDRATTARAASPDAVVQDEAQVANSERSLSGLTAEAAVEAGSAGVPRDKALATQKMDK